MNVLHWNARPARWNRNISLYWNDFTLTTISCQVESLLLNNPNDRDLHPFLNRRLHVATTQHISTSYIYRGHSMVMDEVKNLLINAFYSVLLSTNQLLLSAKQVKNPKNMPICNLSKIIFLLHGMNLLILSWTCATWPCLKFIRPQ